MLMPSSLSTRNILLADADDADLADVGVAHHFLRAHGGCYRFAQQVKGALVVGLSYGEAEVRLPVLADVLDDDVHLDVGVGHWAQDAVGNAGRVGHTEHRDLGFAAVERNA